VLPIVVRPRAFRASLRGAEALCGVLDDWQPVVFAISPIRSQSGIWPKRLTGRSALVRVICNGRFDSFRIDVVSYRVDIHVRLARLRETDRFSRANPGERRRDDFVTGFRCQARAMRSRGCPFRSQRSRNANPDEVARTSLELTNLGVP
jgi:hypothetical protein